MKCYIFLILGGLYLLLSGCHVDRFGNPQWGLEPPALEKDEGLIADAPDTVLIKYETARVAEKRKQFDEALKGYSQLLNEPLNSSIYQSAFIGRSRVLLSMNKPQNALAVLDPLSENPNTLFECRKLAMAGRILAKQQRYSEAEPLLKVAIDKCPKREDAELFMAESLTELGFVEFKLQKHADAIRFFRSASDLYTQNKLEKRARNCTELADYIENN